MLIEVWTSTSLYGFHIARSHRLAEQLARYLHGIARLFNTTALGRPLTMHLDVSCSEATLL